MMVHDRITGKRIVYLSGSMAIPDERAKTTWVVPEKVPARNVKYHLCKAGPKLCAECQLCEWGKTYLRLQEEKKNETAAMAVV